MSPLWYDAVDRPRTCYTQQRCKHHSDSGQHVSSLHDIVQTVLEIIVVENIVLSR